MGTITAMNDADRKAWLAAHDIDTEVAIDEHDNPQLVIDETGMRQLANLAPDPVRAHALVDQWLAEADAQT